MTSQAKPPLPNKAAGPRKALDYMTLFDAIPQFKNEKPWPSDEIKRVKSMPGYLRRFEIDLLRLNISSIDPSGFYNTVTRYGHTYRENNHYPAFPFNGVYGYIFYNHCVLDIFIIYDEELRNIKITYNPKNNMYMVGNRPSKEHLIYGHSFHELLISNNSQADDISDKTPISFLFPVFDCINRFPIHVTVNDTEAERRGRPLMNLIEEFRAICEYLEAVNNKMSNNCDKDEEINLMQIRNQYLARMHVVYGAILKRRQIQMDKTLALNLL